MNASDETPFSLLDAAEILVILGIPLMILIGLVTAVVAVFTHLRHRANPGLREPVHGTLYIWSVALLTIGVLIPLTFFIIFFRAGGGVTV